MTKPRIHVLIVEDDIVDRLSCRRVMLQYPEAEFVFSEADTGRQGLELARSVKPDCILLDYKIV